MKRLLFIGGAVALALVGVITYGLRPPADTAQDAIQALSRVPELDITTNPLEGNIPETNPVEKINPFIYTNPFE
ncbi:MAG: hypothetical protein HYT22_04155 [Candidatus Niyogibacteria bacterium]|nr:hypothetical protein [Candidatus Niyogibacteria bacterium]